MSAPDLTVILPCAGEGSRLGLHSPKELYEVEAGRPMIQYSLDHILTANQEVGKLRTVVVIREQKESVADYVRNQLETAGIEVAVAQFDDQYREWPGSIHSAKTFFTHKNIVLLPDSCLVIRNSGLLADLEKKLREKNLVFGLKETSNPSTITSLGAVSVAWESGEIQRFEDKPLKSSGFNAVWGCFAFRLEIADELHDFLMASVDHLRPDYARCSFYPAGAFRIDHYADLGTWERIEKFKEWRSRSWED